MPPRLQRWIALTFAFLAAGVTLAVAQARAGIA
jgi:hypothetical protein